MDRRRALLRTAIAAFAIAFVAQSPAASPATTTPTSARATVASFFRALESGAFGKACSLLGAELYVETGGPYCPEILHFGMPEPLLWSIQSVRTTRGAVGVRVRLGQNSLGRVRMRTWLAVVRSERGAPKIVETRLLA